MISAVEKKARTSFANPQRESRGKKRLTRNGKGPRETMAGGPPSFSGGRRGQEKKRNPLSTPSIIMIDQKYKNSARHATKGQSDW